MRSYLYPTDLTIWLFFILLKGKENSAYNVGSPHGYSISELAQKSLILLVIKSLEY